MPARGMVSDEHKVHPYEIVTIAYWLNLGFAVVGDEQGRGRWRVA